MKQWVRMNKHYILDTNIALRFLLQDIASQYNQAKRIFADAKSGKINLIIPQIVIFEINFALKKFYHLEKETILEKIEPIISTKYIDVESRQIFLVAIDLYRKENISFVDCFLLSKAKIENAEFFTFDKKLKRLSKNV